MTRSRSRPSGGRIESLRQQIEHWRQTRTKRSPMPEPLWRGAVELARERGVYGASQALQLSYDSLRTRAEAQRVPGRRASGGGDCAQPRFIELAVGSASVATVASGPVVEVMGPQGQRLTVRLQGCELDVAALIRECWAGRA